MAPKTATRIAVTHCLLALPAALGCGGGPDLQHLAQEAVLGTGAQAEMARAALRAAGPAGLEALCEAHRGLLERAETHRDPERLADDAEWRSLGAALDAVGRARDNHAARLYWHTDLEAAKAAARAGGKPILSLRLLGNLDDEFSCANSRFFRTVLYANADVSRLLRDEFVLHWQSVRPVPRVTIDFGDGRVLERTITGNSIHYVLDAEGRPLDGLPGLYSPAEFVAQLRALRALATQSAGPPGALRIVRLGEVDPVRAYHAEALNRLRRRWAGQLMTSGAPVELALSGLARGFPRAEIAAERAFSKMRAELPILGATRLDDWPLEHATEQIGWERLAARLLPDVQLDAGSLRLMRTKVAAASGCRTDAMAGGGLDAIVESFRRSIALDTVRNELLFHREIHKWFLHGVGGDDLDLLNARVYAELFLTPDDDPWLGLLPADVYAALPGGGVRTGPRP
ncbi:MAG: hypothetical protein LC135_02725 [Phycisphaerae bacterium]|nr:hypothetical protein [Phycisphaerae bacterium]MCZ2398769.1 hypothetical protein [Phycisphaerae bacterium]